MSDLVRGRRLELGLTGSELAARLGVTVGAVSQMERAEREGRIQMKTLTRALHAMGQQVLIEAEDESPYSMCSPARTAAAITAALEARDQTFALRTLTQAVKMVRQHPAALTDRELALKPAHLPDAKWQALFLAVYGSAIPQSRRPAWMTASRLPKPWFVSQFAPLREKAKSTTPDYLRDLNIFIDENSLTRA